MDLWLVAGGDEVADNDEFWKRLPGFGVLSLLQSRTDSYPLPHEDSGLTRCLCP